MILIAKLVILLIKIIKVKKKAKKENVKILQLHVRPPTVEVVQEIEKKNPGMNHRKSTKRIDIDQEA